MSLNEYQLLSLNKSYHCYLYLQDQFAVHGYVFLFPEILILTSAIANATIVP